MSKTLAQCVCQLLIDLELGVDPEVEENESLDWHVFYGLVPEAPNNIITVTDTSGRTQGRIQRTGETITIPGIQIRVRGSDYQTGFSKVQEIKAAMDKVFRDEVDFETDGEGYLVNALHRQGDFAAMGPEETNRREEFTMNFLGTYSQV